MRVKVGKWLLLAAVGGFTAGTARAGEFMKNAFNQQTDGVSMAVRYADQAPGMVGPYGTPVPVIAPAVYQEPTGADYARAALMKQYPVDLVDQTSVKSPIQQVRYGCGPGGCGGSLMGAGAYPSMGMPGTPLAPPGMMTPGMMMPGGMAPPQMAPPGIGGPMGPGMGAGFGPGMGSPGMVAMGMGGAGGMPGPGMPGPGMPGPGMGGPGGPGGAGGGAGGLIGPPGAVAAIGAIGSPTGPGGLGGHGGLVQRSEIRFAGPAGMKIAWYAPRTDGTPGFTRSYLEAPARYNFLQCAIYRLKLSDIPLRPGVELYPTLEVVPANPKTSTFLAHSAVPVSFTEEDFEQVAAGNFVVKVIYLPDPRFQDLATTGPDEVVSTRLEPGVDPIAEACRRGCILAIVRIGNIDLEAPNTPAMDAPPAPTLPPGMQLPPGAQAQGGVGAPPRPGAPGNGRELPRLPPPGTPPPLPRMPSAPPPPPMNPVPPQAKPPAGPGRATPLGSLPPPPDDMIPASARR
jgi:hypothetical protein